MSLRLSALSGAKWTSGSTAIVSVLQLIQLAVLARVLEPREFGLVAMIMVVVGFAQAFADMGISNAIIHRQERRPRALSTLFWMNIATGAALTMILLASSPLIVSFYGESQLHQLLPLASLAFLITPVGQQFQILLQQELQFKRLAAVDVVAVAAGLMIAIMTAVADQGAASIIWGQLTLATTKAAMLAAMGWRRWTPLFLFDPNVVREYASFGAYQLGDRTLNYFAANVDYILIGRFLGPTTLGIYTIAYQLAMLVVQKINPVVMRVAFPILARLQSNQRQFEAGYLESSKLVAYAVFPLIIGLAATAPIAVPLALGAEWEVAVPLLQVLALVAVFRAVGNVAGLTYLARGRADIGFKWNAATGAINLVVFVAAVQFGVLSLALAFAFVSFLYFLGGRWLMQQVLGISAKKYLAALIPPAVAASAMGVSVILLRLALEATASPPSLSLAILVVLGAFIYLGVSFTLDRQYIMKSILLITQSSSSVETA